MNKHSGETDKVQKIQLTSSIELVTWTKNSATAGAKVGLEVHTQFVGNNSDISIEISDKSGKKYETIKRKISGNKFWTEITVPEKAKDELYAEVKLSKHSLNQKSNSLYLFPPINITNVKWDKNETYRGDVLKLTADVKGVADGTDAEIEIWEHNADGVHEMITKFPYSIKNGKVNAEWEFQYLGKTESIPASYESESGYQQPQYYFRVKVTELYNDSGLLKFKDWIEIKLIDSEGYPLKNIDYEITLSDGGIKKGKLDEEGYAKIYDIPPGKYEVSFPYLKGKVPEYNPTLKRNYYYYNKSD